MVSLSSPAQLLWEASCLWSPGRWGARPWGRGLGNPGALGHPETPGRPWATQQTLSPGASRGPAGCTGVQQHWGFFLSRGLDLIGRHGPHLFHSSSTGASVAQWGPGTGPLGLCTQFPWRAHSPACFEPSPSLTPCLRGRLPPTPTPAPPGLCFSQTAGVTF